jgi:hypothetical protein
MGGDLDINGYNIIDDGGQVNIENDLNINGNVTSDQINVSSLNIPLISKRLGSDESNTQLTTLQMISKKPTTAVGDGMGTQVSFAIEDGTISPTITEHAKIKTVMTNNEVNTSDLYIIPYDQGVERNFIFSGKTGNLTVPNDISLTGRTLSITNELSSALSMNKTELANPSYYIIRNGSVAADNIDFFDNRVSPGVSRFDISPSGINVKTGGILVNGTSVIDSSRIAKNIVRHDMSDNITDQLIFRKTHRSDYGDKIEKNIKFESKFETIVLTGFGGEIDYSVSSGNLGDFDLARMMWSMEDDIGNKGKMSIYTRNDPTTYNEFQFTGDGNLTLDGSIIANTITSKSTNTNLVLSGNGSGIVQVNDSLNLSSGSEYRINGTSVLSNNTLGSGVVNSSLTSVGTLSSLAVTNNINIVSGNYQVNGTTVIDSLKNAVFNNSRSGNIALGISNNNPNIIGTTTGNLILAAQSTQVRIASQDDLYLDGPDTESGTTAAITASGKIVKSSSSVRYKTNIEDLEIDSEKIYEIRPVSFYYKNNIDVKQIGYIAEEINELIPDIVYLNNEGQPESIQYDRLVVPIIMEMKNLKQIINTQQEQINNLLIRINNLENNSIL